MDDDSQKEKENAQGEANFFESFHGFAVQLATSEDTAHSLGVLREILVTDDGFEFTNHILLSF